MHSAMAQGGRSWRSEPTVGVALRAVLACTKKTRAVCATRAVRVATMGIGVASTMQPAAHMPVPPPRAQGKDGVASLGRTLARAAPTALDGPFAERVLTARRERSGGCGPVCVSSRVSAMRKKYKFQTRNPKLAACVRGHPGGNDYRTVDTSAFVFDDTRLTRPRVKGLLSRVF